MKIELRRVRHMPRVLSPGVLYVAEEFGAAAHLCPCGCGTKVRTPLGPTDWSLEDTDGKPTLRPSIGNWQHPCQSHYWIEEGEIVWAENWTPEEIMAGRQAQTEREDAYYAHRDRRLAGRLARWLRNIVLPRNRVR